MTSEQDQNLGGGAGGGADDSGNVLLSANGAYQIAGNQVVLLSRPPVADLAANKGPNVIAILAAGNGTDGQVDVRGSRGVRITAGPPALPGLSPGTGLATTNGIEIDVAASQSIELNRGDPLLPTSQSIALSPGLIVVDSGAGDVIIRSLTKITLAVGLSSITIDALEGITIVGLPNVQINPLVPLVPPEPLPPLPPGEAYA